MNVKDYTNVSGVVTVIGDRVLLVPLGVQFTDDEITEFRSGETVSLSEKEEQGRRVLNDDLAVSVDNLLRLHEGKVVSVFIGAGERGPTREESDDNLMKTRSADPYVFWTDYDLPFVCPDGIKNFEERASAIAYGTLEEKTAVLDIECPCGRNPHRYVFRKNRLTSSELEDLVMSVLDGEEETSRIMERLTKR